MIEPTLKFFGEIASEAEKAEAASRSGIVALVAAVAGIAIATYAARWRRFAWALAHGALATLTAVMFLAMASYEEPHAPGPPEPMDHHPCYSGSNDCPGG